MKTLIILALSLVGCGSRELPTETIFGFEGNSEQREAVQEALSEWKSVCTEITARLANSGEDSYASIKFVEDVKDYAAVTVFENSTIYVENKFSYERTRAIMLHELGHWFSWSHEHLDQNVVMHPNTRAEHLTETDIDFVCR